MPEADDSHSVTLKKKKKNPVMGLKIHNHAHKSLSLDRYPDPLSVCLDGIPGHMSMKIMALLGSVHLTHSLPAI